MKENNKSLLAGLAVIIATVVIVALVGIFAIHPQKEIIAGEHDDLPESAFLFVGSIDEAVAKAKKGE
ncbi:MAG: hypothetical protein IKX32_02925 [Bacteroidales bacterium]|nr:hypothetical protein [Bacteroidales bacterium]